MKKALKYIGILIGIIILFIIAFVVYINVMGVPNYSPPDPITFNVVPDSSKVALGYKLTLANCTHCHSPLQGNQLIGRQLLDMGPDFGIIYSSNITQHPTAGIGNWSDGELAYFLRTGIRKDGSFSPPYMPKFPLMADTDLEAIIAYLRSDHPTVQANDHETPPSKPSFLVKALTNTVIKPYPYPEKPIAKPDIKDQVAYGKYLATGQLGCYHCHSADFTKVNSLEPEKSLGFFGGGNKIYDHYGDLHLSSNITMHETGIADYTADQFVKAVRQGIKADGQHVNLGMPIFPTLQEDEVLAIFEYLKTVPSIDNAVVHE